MSWGKDKMNRATDEGNHLMDLRSYLFTLLHFLWFKFKSFNQVVFCERPILKFLKKQIQWTSAILPSHGTSRKVRKYIDIFTVIRILFLVKITQTARLFSSCVILMQ